MNNQLPYPWLAKEWQHLIACVLQQRIPQALLIKGKQGLGKVYLALQFAQYVLCSDTNKQQHACGQCESCRLFTAQTHPDFIHLAPKTDKKTLGIDIIRDLITTLALKPQYSGYRMVLIQAADCLTMNAANAFLKCLEEPPERTFFLLVLEHSTHLPVTIMSRCQQLLLTPPDYALAEQWLQTQGVNQEYTALLNMANGAPLLALHYAETEALVLRKSCFHAWYQVLIGKQCPVALAETWHTLSLPLLLVWLCSWVEDLIKYHLNITQAYCANSDLAVELQALIETVALKALFNFYRLLLQSRDDVQTSVNKQLLVEEILISTCRLAS